MSREDQQQMTMLSDVVPLWLQQSHMGILQPVARGNIIKANRVKLAGAVTVQRPDSSAGEPTVVIQREGETVTGIEFCCVCGKTSAIRLDYGGE